MEWRNEGFDCDWRLRDFLWSEFFSINVSLCYEIVFKNMSNWILKIFKKNFFSINLLLYFSLYISLYYITIYLNIIDNLIFKDSNL